MELPYIEIEAENEQAAAELVLAYNSQYGKVTEEGLIEFTERFDLDLDEIQEFIEIREVNALANMEEGSSVEKVDKLGSLRVKCPECGHEFEKEKKKKE